jgi:hypothetical protein
MIGLKVIESNQLNSRYQVEVEVEVGRIKKTPISGALILV